MTLVHCRHLDKIQITKHGDERMKYLCSDCGESSLGPLPDDCLHTLSVKAAGAMVNGKAVDTYGCSKCIGVFAVQLVSFKPGELNVGDF